MLGEEPIELGLKGHEQEFLNTLRRDPVYQRLFPKAFPEGGDVYTLQECHQSDCRVRADDHFHEVAL